MRRLQNIETLALLLGVLIMMTYLCSAKPILSSLSMEDINKMSSSIAVDFNQMNSTEKITTTTTKSLVVPHIPTKFYENNPTTNVEITKFYQSQKNKKFKKILMNDTQRILSRTDRSVDLIILNNSLSGVKRVKNFHKASILERNERSTNLSHIAGSTRRIQLYIKNRFLQILNDGTVNGTTDDNSEYTIVQRTTVNVGQIKIQALATCLFLCMDACGNTYGSAQFNEDCVFNENIEQHHYNTYSSTFHSNEKRRLYLGLNRHGQTRKVILPSSRQLGKLSTYTNSLTHPISHDRVNKLLEKKFGLNHGRHSLKQLCESEKVGNEFIKPKQKCDSNNMKVKLNNNNKKKKNQKCSDQESDVENNKNNKNCTLNSIQQQANKNDQSIKISDKKKQQSAQNSRKCHKDSSLNKQKSNNEKKPAKNINKNNNNSNIKATKSDTKCFEKNKIKQKKRKRKKITTTPKSVEVDLKLNAAANEDENFASDEIESEEDEYDDIVHGLNNPLSNFVANNDVDEDV